MPAAQQYSPGSPALVLDEMAGAAEDSIGTVSPFLVRAHSGPKPSRKKLVRRDDREYSEPLRLGVQLFLVALNLWVGIQFYLWVRWAESGGRALEVSRPAGVEGWLPIEGLMQLKYFFVSGNVPHVHAAGFFLFTSFLVVSFAFRKAFCSWLCPVGTVSEYLWKLGRATFHHNFQLPRWADIALRSLKYVLLSFFAYAVASMSAAIAEFLGSPYALIVDVRMLNFFRYLGSTAALVFLGMAIASIFVQNFWCRYLCPYGAFLGLVSLLSPSRIARNLGNCIDCAKCAKACPSALPVDKLVQIRLRRVYRMPGVRCGLSRKRRAGDEPTSGFAEAPHDSGLEHGRGNCDHLLRPDRLCQVGQSLEHRPAETGLPTARAGRERAAAPYTGCAVWQIRDSPMLRCEADNGGGVLTWNL